MTAPYCKPKSEKGMTFGQVDARRQVIKEVARAREYFIQQAVDGDEHGNYKNQEKDDSA